MYPHLNQFSLNEATEDRKDVLKMTVPLFIRLMEYAREDAKTDMDLHTVAEKAAACQKVMDMSMYDKLVGKK